MKLEETAVRQVSLLLNTQSESEAGKRVFMINRTNEEEMVENPPKDYPFLLAVSFEQYQEDGTAVNEAEIFLRSGDYQQFITGLLEHEYLLPTNYRQWKEEIEGGICIHMEATEPPGLFAARLAAVMQKIGSEFGG